MKSLVLALVVLVAACANKPSAHECASGIICPDPLQCAAVQPVCISNLCGNGITDPGETCDDGNIINGDGCSADCKSAEACGDNVTNTDAGEVCDDGNTDDGDGCSSDCKSNETCGNGITDSAKGEACDDGNTHAGKCSGDDHECDSTADCTAGTCVPDGCSGDCKSNETCGNGIKDLGEVCDDAHATGGCEDDCLHGAGCGNGVLDTGEQCDDGNSINTDDCKNDCTPNVCGDNVVDSSGTHHHEDCDPGTGGVPLETATCNIDCTTAKCGDGKVNSHHLEPGSTVGEQCDLGSTTAVPPVNLNQDNVDCTSKCVVNTCGDGLVDNLGQNHHESCDDQNTNNNDGCRNDCKSATCGDGVVQIGSEQCDDGNTVDDDACNNSCMRTSCGDGIRNNGEACDPTAPHAGADSNGAALCNSDCTVSACGDGKVNAGAGETCDDGNAVDTDACPSGAANPNKCKVARCGDGKVFTGVEQCDTGNTTDTASCYAAKCTTSTCGDGHINTVAGEACDNGALNGTPGNACNAFCQAPSCGNGQIDSGEQCDSGTGHPNIATCDSDCTKPVCGDGLKNTAAGEACDDGVNNTDSVVCPYNTSCTRCSTTCAVLNTTTPSCGDGTVDGDATHVETCDDAGATQTKTACTYGTQSACTACHTCTLVVLPARYCGNSIVDTGTGETCDPPGLAGCRASGAPCTSCSDGVKNGGETDQDCGGGATGCPTTCAVGKLCAANTDCASGKCTGNVCTAASCTDGVKNGAESDLDCGGGTCAACPATKACLVVGDCQSGVCSSNVCQAATCTDLVQNGGESAVDCGGTSTCGACAGATCAVNGDCASNVCKVDMTCQ